MTLEQENEAYKHIKTFNMTALRECVIQLRYYKKRVRLVNSEVGKHKLSLL